MRKDKVVSFRMNDDDQQALDKCFELFSYVPSKELKSFTSKMIWLIHKIHDELKSKNEIIKSKDNEIVKLKERLEPKKEVATPSQKIEAPKVLELKPSLNLSKTEFIMCPSLKRRIPKTNCNICKTSEPIRWEGCQELQREQKELFEVKA